MRTCTTIAAINTDEKAPFSQLVDFGVGGLFAVLPQADGAVKAATR